MANDMFQAAVERLTSTPAQRTFLRRTDFQLQQSVANQRTRVARYQAPNPFALRTDAATRLVFVAAEEFTTDGTADNQETFTLSHDLIKSPNTEDLVLYEGGNVVQPDSVDYGADSFTYTDDATGSTLYAYYVPRDPVSVQIEKTAPPSEGDLSYTLFDGATSLIHVRNQNKEPIRFDAAHPLDLVVPKKWHLDVYADGPVAFDWEEDTDGTTAVNAILSVPIVQATREVPGLEQAVKQRMISPSPT